MAVLDFTYNMSIKFSLPVLKHCYTLRCIPLECESQHIEDIKVTVFPENELTYSSDGFGNILVTDRIVTMHNEFTVDVTGTVTTGAPGTDATATITGTSPDFVLNLTIPQGPTGPAA